MTRLRWMEKRHRFALVLLLCLVGTQTACYTRVGTPGKAVGGSVVKNVEFSIWQRQKIKVRYDLVGSGEYSVSLLLFDGDGNRFYPRAVDGAVGMTKPGTRKTIVWEVLQDMPQGLAGNYYVFEVTASQAGYKVNRGAAVIGGAVALLAGAGVAADQAGLLDKKSDSGTIVIDVADPEGQ